MVGTNVLLKNISNDDMFLFCNYELCILWIYHADNTFICYLVVFVTFDVSYGKWANVLCGLLCAPFLFPLLIASWTMKCLWPLAMHQCAVDGLENRTTLFHEINDEMFYVFWHQWFTRNIFLSHIYQTKWAWQWKKLSDMLIMVINNFWNSVTIIIYILRTWICL